MIAATLLLVAGRLAAAGALDRRVWLGLLAAAAGWSLPWSPCGLSMAMIINPSGQRVSDRGLTLHLGLLAAGVAGGAVLTYAVVHTLYRALGLASPAVWLLIALSVVALAAPATLGVKAPVRYPIAR